MRNSNFIFLKEDMKDVDSKQQKYTDKIINQYDFFTGVRKRTIFP